MTHSFESGVLEQENMKNMQGGVPWGPGLGNTALSQQKLVVDLKFILQSSPLN